MKIGYFADGPWSHLALDKIVASSALEVVFIVPRYDSQDPILKGMAAKINVPFIPLKDINADDSLAIIKSYNPDLNVSMSFNQILKNEILGVAPKGFINCHAGELPFYRGRNILNWVLINDADRFGVTVHYIDLGIDTGDIITQKTSPILDEDDYASLLERATHLCAETLFDALCLIENDTVSRIPQNQIHPVGFYCPRRIKGDEIIDWNWTSRRVFNFIRSISSPGPCARTFFNSQEILVEKAEFIPDAPTYISTTGTIIAKENNAIIVKTGDSFISITKLRVTEDHLSLRIGDRLSSHLIMDKE
jgi:methionyl-tRNA formyltransferase